MSMSAYTEVRPEKRERLLEICSSFHEPLGPCGLEAAWKIILWMSLFGLDSSKHYRLHFVLLLHPGMSHLLNISAALWNFLYSHRP